MSELAVVHYGYFGHIIVIVYKEFKLMVLCLIYNLPNKQIERLQRIQNQAARMLKRIPRRNHITPVLRELHWLRIHDIIIF